jgi:hypothetical protein
VRRIVVLGLGVAALIAPSATLGATGGVTIDVLSNRADLISGGDALVAIVRRAAARLHIHENTMQYATSVVAARTRASATRSRRGRRRCRR